jgi:hypothetical protein
MTITEEQFKNICDKKSEENRILAEQSLFYYFYLLDPLGIHRDNVKYADIVEFPNTVKDVEKKEDAKKVANHVAAYGRTCLEKGLEWKRSVQTIIDKIKNAQSLTENTAMAEPDDEPLDPEVKLEQEIIEADNEDFSRINNIDIKKCFSFYRIFHFSTLLRQLSHTLPRYDQEDLNVRIQRYMTLEEYDRLLHDKFKQLEGYWSVDDRLKEFQSSRTKKSTASKKINRRIKENIVCDEYRKWLKEQNKETIKHLSESKMAEIIKKGIIDDLKEKGINKISVKTIIDILRKRDKIRLPTYPWKP